MWKTSESSPQNSLLEKAIRIFLVLAVAKRTHVAPGRIRKSGKSGKLAHRAEACNGRPQEMDKRECMEMHHPTPLKDRKKGRGRPIARGKERKSREGNAASKDENRKTTDSAQKDCGATTEEQKREDDAGLHGRAVADLKNEQCEQVGTFDICHAPDRSLHRG